MLQDSGLGTIIGPALEKSGLPLILIAFLIALLVRASVGSSIVAMTMASGVMATMPAVMATSMLYRAAMCCAICGGATALSHVNDAGFWLVGTFLEIDENNVKILDDHGNFDRNHKFDHCVDRFNFCLGGDEG